MSFSLQLLSPSLAPVDQKMLLASIQRHLERNERARLRMARHFSTSSKRAELKLRPVEEQERAAERSRVYRARYRERHHQAVLKGNPNAAAKSISSGTAKKLTRNTLNGASVGGGRVMDGRPWSTKVDIVYVPFLYSLLLNVSSCFS
ncbi:hypothetical protein MVEN_02212500 [Mycena venus]|uniref:Uncharacterized protein n=1 Tax=Mycena venus TaxID=2733690 RepID=A0A8H6X6V4_9AGAR|nr:hypothetical protein MVEN_02212500 [Mycena venus]